MDKKSWKRGLAMLMLSSSFLLSACQAKEKDQPEESEGTEQVDESKDESPSFTSTGQYYRPVIRDGSYRPSQSRGVTQRLNSTINLKAFENGLMEVAQDHFSTDSHYFEEGQYISDETVKSWLNRKTKDNAQGLNPSQAGKGEDYVPIYLESILEQDFYIENQKGMKLDGIVIGLAMNSVDYYQEIEFGPTLSQDIPREDVVIQAKEMINKILSQVRELEELRDIPIIFAVFEQSSSDDLAGGTYIGKVVSPSGTQLEDYQELDREKHVLPLEGEGTTIANEFNNFKDDIEGFFPNLSGVTAIASYDGDRLKKLDVDIDTRFFGEGEMIAFSQYIEMSALKNLPTNIPIEIKVQSIDDVEAFLYSDGKSGQYFSHVFN